MPLLVNPAEIAENLAAKLRAIPELVAMLGGSADRISVFHDTYPEASSLSRAVYELESPGILIAYQGWTKGSFGEGSRINHNFSIFARAGEEPLGGGTPRSYHAIGMYLIDGVPTGETLTMEHQAIHTSCYEMEIAGGWERRSDPEQVDYFELQITFGQR